MREIINRTIANEIRRTGGVNRKDQNLISYGYRGKVRYQMIFITLEDYLRDGILN
jgi:hypothetical protein